MNIWSTIFNAVKSVIVTHQDLIFFVSSGELVLVMTVKLEKGDAAQCFSSLPEHKERVGAGNHRPVSWSGQLLIVMKQRTDSIFSSRKQEIFLSDWYWSWEERLFKALKYYPTLHTLTWERKQRVASISF